MQQSSTEPHFHSSRKVEGSETLFFILNLVISYMVPCESLCALCAISSGNINILCRPSLTKSQSLFGLPSRAHTWWGISYFSWVSCGKTLKLKDSFTKVIKLSAWTDLNHISAVKANELTHNNICVESLAALKFTTCWCIHRILGMRAPVWMSRMLLFHFFKLESSALTVPDDLHWNTLTPLSFSSTAVTFIWKYCQGSGNEFLGALLTVL